MKKPTDSPCGTSFSSRCVGAFLLAMLMFPTLAIAAGAEDTEYIGLLQNNKLARIRFVGDAAAWTKGNLIYGAAGHVAFKYCWRDSAKLQNTQSGEPAPNAPSAVGTTSAEAPVYFNCTSRKGANFSISYRSVATGTEAKQLFANIAGRARLGNGSRRGDGSLTRVYECKLGCVAALPRLIFEVTHYD